GRPGINYTPVSLAPEDLAPIERAVATARETADLVIFTIHWGPNMRARPTDTFRAFARRVIDAGADLFWGHSAHVVQGIEFWHGKPILYDTGDFVDDYAVDEVLRNDLSALFLATVRPPAVERLELLPVEIRRMQVTRAEGLARDWIARRLATLCAEMGTRLVDRGGRLVAEPA
ncbi:MAG: CapA family protein, partial [Thermomicrobiaceae bacterium]|nr:CapA family protein [Thermomicrobiaceae bacterium]